MPFLSCLCLGSFIKRVSLILLEENNYLCSDASVTIQTFILTAKYVFMGENKDVSVFGDFVKHLLTKLGRRRETT